jgi:putative sterol carrier protein
MAMKIEAVFDKLTPLLEKGGADIVKKVGYVYHFEISPAKGKPATVWTLDLKNGNGSLTKGKNGKADATFAMTDADAVAIFDRTLNPQTAFMQGKMKIKGNMGAAQKFTPDTFGSMGKL